MAWDAGVITSATPWASLSTKLKNLVGGTGVENWSFVENVPAGTGTGQSGSASYSLDVFRCRGATNLYKRIVQVNLFDGGDTNAGNATTLNFTVTTPGTNQFITVFVSNTKATAADDPTSVSLDGSNAPTFTKIKSQASGAGTPLLKGTLWIGKTGGSAPTGTTLSVVYPAAPTGVAVIMDQWDGCDVTLSANNVDATGASQIGIQVVGGSGTTTPAGHSATLASMLGPQSIAVTWAAETASTTAYTAEAGWVALAADISVATPTMHARGMFRPYQDDLTGVLTSGTTALTDWACIALEFQRTTSATSITSANDALQDWYFIIEIPASDGAVNSVFNCSEDYDGNKLFNRMPPTAANAAPVGIGSQGWRADTLIAYASVTGNNRANLGHQILNTTGFSYWIKLTKNAVSISTRVSATEAMSGAMLLDSFVTNQTDLPLINVSNVALGNTMSRLPGVTAASGASTQWECSTLPWTSAAAEGFTTNASGAQDLWSSQKIHVARIFVEHTVGRSLTLATSQGFARGLWKSDFLCFTRGGTVQLGDTMTIAGNTWTVISNSANLFGGTGGLAMIVVTRAN